MLLFRGLPMTLNTPMQPITLKAYDKALRMMRKCMMVKVGQAKKRK